MRERCHGESGAVIPELALMLPFLVVMFLGVADAGFAFRQSETLVAAVRQGARTASSQGSGRQADYQALTSLVASTRELKNVTINRVIIFKTTSADGAPTNADCFTKAAVSTGTGESGCNIYSPTQLASLSTSQFDAVGCAGDWDQYWCPTSRESRQGATNGPDYLGVRVVATYTSLTGVFPATLTLTETAIYRLEPVFTQATEF